MVDMHSVEERIANCEQLTMNEVLEVNKVVQEMLTKERNVVQVRAPVTICGDIHGQFYDLKELFRHGGFVPHTSYVFLGDYVDRGFFSVETIMWLLTLKVNWPDRLTLLRGNHESRNISQTYGFYEESIRKYGSVMVWRTCCETFDYMPLVAVIDNEIFCVHGGLSPCLSTIDEIHTIDRKVELPYHGFMADLLWSDPEPIQGWGVSGRGAGYIYGESVTEDFHRVNGTTLIARAHQLVMEGYAYMFDRTLVTVWSAPNYSYRSGNVASVCEVSPGTNNGDTNKGSKLSWQFNIFGAAAMADRSIPTAHIVPDYFV